MVSFGKPRLRRASAAVLELTGMMRLQILIALVLATSCLAQTDGPCFRAFAHTPIHEQIFLARLFAFQRPPSRATQADG